MPDQSQQQLFDQAAPTAPPDRVVGSELGVRPARVIAPPAPGLRRVRAVIAYDGGAFHGFAPNDGIATVTGTLNATLARIVQTEIAVVGAGRTDAGVHARAQVISFDAPSVIDLARLQRSVNSMCAPSLVVRDIAWAADDFNARFSARWRHYRYAVLNAPWPDPLIANRSWHVRAPLDVLSMQLACDPFVGTHDFTSFCRQPKVSAAQRSTRPPRSMVRRIIDAHWDRPNDDGVLMFHITANAFCHQMVRAIVGFLVEVGQGERHAGEVLAVLRAKDRSWAGIVAPAQGLTLWHVGYDDEHDLGSSTRHLR